MMSLNPFRKKTPAHRLRALEDSLGALDGRLAEARERLADLVAETGDPESEDARRLSALISELSTGRESLRSAVPKVRAEVDEAERMRAETDRRRLSKAAQASLVELAEAATEFDQAAVLMESALTRFKAAHQNASRAVGDAGGKLAAAHVSSRVTAALFAGAPTVYRMVVERLRTGLPLSNGQRVSLAASFAISPAPAAVVGDSERGA